MPDTLTNQPIKTKWQELADCIERAATLIAYLPDPDDPSNPNRPRHKQFHDDLELDQVEIFEVRRCSHFEGFSLFEMKNEAGSDTFCQTTDPDDPGAPLALLAFDTQKQAEAFVRAQDLIDWDRHELRKFSPALTCVLLELSHGLPLVQRIDCRTTEEDPHID